MRGVTRPAEKKKHGKRLFTLRGEKGKLPRRVLIAAGVAVLLLLMTRLFRAEPMALSSAEIATIWDNGVLRVGVRSDVPGMGENGTGLETELAALLAQRIMSADADWTGGTAVELVEVTSMNVAVKLTDGDIDAAICLMPKGAFSGYSYSSSYYTDPIYFLARRGEGGVSITSSTVIGYIQSASSTSLYVPTGAMYNALSAYITARAEEGFTLADNTVKYASYDELFRALEGGDVDVVVLTGIMAAKYADTYSFSVCSGQLGSIDYALACLSDNSAVAAVMDTMLSEMRADGTLEALKAEYGLSGD